MLEWVTGAAVLVLVALFEDSGKKTWAPPPSPPRPPQGRPDDDAMADWLARCEAAVSTGRWIPKSEAARLVARFPPPPQPNEHIFRNAAITAERKLQEAFAARNRRFLVEEKMRLKPFFATVEKQPLTDEQIDACVCMDDAVMIVAAAGSGKTSTMIAKAGYVVREKLAAPEQVLLLAFNNAAAAELRERVQSRLATVDGVERITAETFNKFGLLVIGAATGSKPRVADLLGDEVREATEIVNIVAALRAADPAFGRDWDEFRTVYGRDLRQTMDAPGGVRPRLPTLNGEWVKSLGEQRIANWLFRRGVRYHYERDYRHSTATPSHSQYKPDFYYPDVELYHEHYALDVDGTSPFGSDYLAGRRWKRQLHDRHATALFETASHEMGTALERLEEELERRGVVFDHDPTRVGKGPPPLTSDQLASTMRKFQQQAKNSGLTIEDLRSAVAALPVEADTARAIRFVALYGRIAVEWDRRLRDSGCVDFEDMIVAAAEHIESGRYVSPYRIILADEFQDSSRARVRLLKALVAQAGADARLCVVGDDWQAINRFAGADLSAMTGFEQRFAHATRLTLGTTFRSPAQLCSVASTFILANPQQIAKTVTTTSTHTGPALAAWVSASRQASMDLVHEHLSRLAAEQPGASVMLLGRYKNDAPPLGWVAEFEGQLDLRFRTVHTAKGLEADYVLLLNFVGGTTGFPSRVEDDPLMTLVLPDADPFPEAEERRLFYVALTRARRQVRLYTISNRDDSSSSFLDELEEAGAINIRSGTRPERPRQEAERLPAGMSAGDRCTVCGEGVLVARAGPYSSFLGCSSYPDCKAVAPFDGPRR